MKIGFIGLGIMGSRMATNLQKNNNQLVVYNRTKERAEPLIAGGALWADSPADVAREVSILVTMLSTPDVVREMACGESGFLEHLPEDSLWIDCSTVNPSFSKEMAKRAEERNIRFIDAPVAGSKVPAEKGELLFLVGGNKDDVEFCSPLLHAMGKKTVHIGEHGMGAAMKMVNNVVLGGAMAIFSEALVFGLSLGISRETLFNALLSSPVAAPFLSLKKPLFENEKFDAQFPLKWMHKDLQLASNTAYESGIAMPAGHAVKEVFALAKQNGLGDKDFAAVYDYLSGKK